MFFLISAGGGVLYAQDPHFSQYFASPLTMNPANTGNFEGSNRMAMNFRQQWMGVGDPFVTGTVSVDSKILRNKLNNDDKFGIGLMGLYDQSLGSALLSSYGAFSIAYHKALDEDGYQTLAVGFQPVIGNRRLDYSKVSFYRQFGSNGFDLSLPNGESFKTASIVYFDFNSGLMYNYQDEERSLYAGFSYYHMTRPKQSFLGDTSYRLPARFNVHLGASLLTGEYGRLFFSGTAMQQSGSSETALGVSYGYSVPSAADNTMLVVGAWYRMKDAIYPYVGLQFNSMLLGFSYDVTTSNLSLANTKNKSIEVSCILNFKDNREIRKLVPWY
jgi:type IX secretion system PorP/SprF family membrane protein